MMPPNLSVILFEQQLRIRFKKPVDTSDCHIYPH